MDEENQKSTPVIEWDVNTAAIAEVAEELKDIDAYQDLDAAKKAKKQLQGMRSTLTEAHKETKADALAFGRLVDTKKNEYLALIKKIEDPISEQLDAIKNAARIAEETRVNAIEEHLFTIDELAINRHECNLDELQARQEKLRGLPITAEIFQEMLETAETHVQDVEMKLRIAVQAEKDRIETVRAQAEIAENNRIEQERLDKEREEFEAEKAAAKANQDAIDADNRRKDDEKRAADRKEMDDRQAAIDEETSRLADEAATRAADEAAEEAARIAAQQAPDAEKLAVFADELNMLIRDKPVMQSEAGANAMLEAIALLIEIEDDLNKRIGEMK